MKSSALQIRTAGFVRRPWKRRHKGDSGSPNFENRSKCLVLRSRLTGSNRRPADYKSAALCTEIPDFAGAICCHLLTDKLRCGANSFALVRDRPSSSFRRMCLESGPLDAKSSGYPAWIRTMNNASKGRCVTVTPRGNWYFRLSAAQLNSQLRPVERATRRSGSGSGQASPPLPPARAFDR